jgi:hypothetical protein
MQIGHDNASAVPLGDALLLEHSLVFSERQTFQVQGRNTETAKLVDVRTEAVSGPVEMAALAKVQAGT